MSDQSANGGPDLSVVIVSWNTRGCLPKALDALAAACHGLAVETIVVDNGSEDGSVALLGARDHIDLVALECNTGFTHAANIGARRARGRLLVFLNPDAVTPPGSLTALAEVLDGRPDAWGATPWFVFPDGSPQFFWHRLPNRIRVVACLTRWGKALDRRTGFRLRSHRRYEYPAAPRDAVAIEAVGAACLMVRRAEFAAAGAFDERYFNFGQDTEYARAQRRAGRLLLGVGPVSVIHEAGVTFKTLPRWEYEGQLLQAILQFLQGEPWYRRLPSEAAVKLDLLLPGPDAARRRRRARIPNRTTPRGIRRLAGR